MRGGYLLVKVYDERSKRRKKLDFLKIGRIMIGRWVIMTGERGEKRGRREEAKGMRRNRVIRRVGELIVRRVLRISMYVVLSNIRKME